MHERTYVYTYIFQAGIKEPFNLCTYVHAAWSSTRVTVPYVLTFTLRHHSEPGWRLTVARLSLSNDTNREGITSGELRTTKVSVSYNFTLLHAIANVVLHSVSPWGTLGEWRNTWNGGTHVGTMWGDETEAGRQEDDTCNIRIRTYVYSTHTLAIEVTPHSINEEAQCVYVFSYHHVSASFTQQKRILDKEWEYVTLEALLNTQSIPVHRRTYVRMYVHTVPWLGESQLTFTLVAVIVKVKPLGGFGGPAAKKSEESPHLHCTS